LLKPEWQELRAVAIERKGCDGSDEDVLTYAMFPAVGTKFFATRAHGPKNLGKDPDAKPAVVLPVQPAGNGNGNGAAQKPVTYEVRLNGNTHKVTVSTI
jgi:methylmalonyl-CoA carboxyltransferase 5S subunit